MIAKLPPDYRLVCQKKAEFSCFDLYQAGQDFCAEWWFFKLFTKSFTQLNMCWRSLSAQENAALALQTFLLFMGERKEAIDEQAVRKALEQPLGSGRWAYSRPHFYLGCAHNLPADSLGWVYQRKRAGRLSTPQILWRSLKRRLSQGMGCYLTEFTPQVKLKMTGFLYQGFGWDRCNRLPCNSLLPRIYQQFRRKGRRSRYLLFYWVSLFYFWEVRLPAGPWADKLTPPFLNLLY